MKDEQWIKARVDYYFEQERFNCAQSAAMVLAEALDMPTQPFAQMLNGFGAGIAGSRNVCGAVTGAIAAVCQKTSCGRGRTQDAEGYNVANALSQQLYDAFCAQFSTALCCELTGVARGDAAAQAAFLAQGGHTRVCNACVCAACKIALDILGNR